MLIAQDKANHLFYGGVIFAIVFFFISVLWAWLAVIVAATIRELMGDRWDLADFLTTLAGALPPFLCTTKFL